METTGLSALGPDGKLVLTYDEERRQVTFFSASLQQAIGGSELDLYREVTGLVGRVLEDGAARLQHSEAFVGYCGS